MQSKLYFLFLMLIIPIVSNAKIKLPKVFCDHMVMQREHVVPVWGWAAVAEKISVKFLDKEYQTIGNNDGEWRIELPPMKHGGPFEMVITTSMETIRIKDIWIGDVWICSGQSNMEWNVNSSRDSEMEIKNATDTKIRHFKVPRTTSFKPEAELVDGKWETCSPQTVGDFTAVGYYFARSLRDKHDVPIGLLNTSWGGSRLEPWMSAEALGYENADEASALLKKSVEDKRAKLLAELKSKLSVLPEKDNGLVEGRALWAASDYDDSGWPSMELPGLWETKGLEKLDGVVWFRKEIILTEAEAAESIELHLGKIDDGDKTWVNGQLVGAMDFAYNVERIYKVSPDILRPGKNIIAIRVSDTGYGGGIYGTPESLAYHFIDGSKTLVGSWKYKIGMVDLTNGIAQNQVPTILYNQMVHPILNFPIKGVIWYQGESNASGQDAIDYHPLFATMIQDWRKQWACGDFPFLFVQLANFMEAKPEPGESDWAVLRASQSKTLAVPNTGQAVIIDIGAADDIHPENKQDVGGRLALAARHLAYKEELVYSGPVYKSMKIEKGKIRLSFEHIGSGLMSKDKDLKAFAIAGADQKFVWAKAEIKGTDIIVWSDKVPNPVAVRYAWADNPENANLYNKEGLPASPFRTDEF